LLHLSARVRKEVREKDSMGADDAIRVMFALAIDLLLVAPIRVDNLAGLEIARHFVSVRRGRLVKACQCFFKSTNADQRVSSVLMCLREVRFEGNHLVIARHCVDRASKHSQSATAFIMCLHEAWYWLPPA
jgi:hypothetical protein